MNFLDTVPPPAETPLESTLFRLGMWWRVFYGVLRLILSFLLLHFIDSSFSSILYSFLSHEIIEDPNDFLIRVVYPFLESHTFTVTYFLAAYLFFWGIIDIFLSFYILRHKLWAFPVGIVLISLFVLYEIYRFTHTHSLFLAFIIIVDSFIIWLTYREYIRLRNTHSGQLSQ